MRKLFLASIVLAASATGALAGGHGHPGNVAFGGSARAISGSNATANAAANARAVGYGGQGGQGGSVVSSGNSYYRNRWPASSAVAPSVALGGGNVCGSQFSGGIQTFGFGFSLGVPIEQEQCTYRENAKIVTAISGNRTAGLLVLAQEPGMRAALVGSGLLIEPTWDGSTWVYPRSAYRRAYRGR